MAVRQCLQMSLLVMILPLVTPRIEKKRILEDDIHRFLNVSEKLWVYNTTQKQERGKTICRYDLKYNISEEQIFFHRFYNKSFWEQKLLRGDFHRSSDDAIMPYNAMFVFDAGGKVVGIEAVEYASKAYKCAIFSVILFKSGVPAERELRVSEQILKNGPGTACRKAFEKLLGKVNRTFKAQYSSTCQHLPPTSC
uniref:Lipocalin/cytosolic fatty-acid binding domain-containing protein n=1 Tax=Amblyomma maculatum TaxID=34609 RepID=G3MMM6_AMBMU